jgi:outer membrane receptor protein involved in Fe transport
MKVYTLFKIFAISLMLAASGLSASAQVNPKSAEQAIDEEMKWLKAEAEIFTVTVATRTKVSVNKAPSIISVITEDEIKNSGAKNLEEVLRQVAGFYMQGYATYPDKIVNIRGLGLIGNPGVKIMLNGHSSENIGDDNSGYLISFPVELIKKIEIIRGPGSALYGNEAMNGVINIIAKDEKDPSAISAVYGSFGTYEGTAQLSYSQNDISLFLFADAVHSNGDPKLIEKDAALVQFPPGYSRAPGYTNEEFDFQNLFAKLSYKNFRLTGFYKKSKAEPAVGPTGALTDNSDVRFDTAFAEAAYEYSPSSKIKLTARAYYDYNCSDLLYEFYSGKTTAFAPVFKDFPEGEGMLGHLINKTDKLGAEVMSDITFSDSLGIVAGVMGEYSELFDTDAITNANISGKSIELDGITYTPMAYIGGMREPFEAMEEGHRTVYAAYIQGTYDILKTFPSWEIIGKNMSITTGLRYDHHSDADGSLNPRMGVVYAPNDRLFFKLLYGQAFRAPTFGQMYVKNLFASVQNPDLKPETVKTSEILAGLNLTDRITATLDFFSIRKEDAILSYRGRYENRGEIVSRGVEGELRVSYNKSKYGYFNITFQKAEDVSHEKIADTLGTVYEQEDYGLGMYPQVMANMGINYDISKNINANVSVNYVGQIERIGKMQFTSDKNDPDGTLVKSDKRELLDSHTLVNFSLRFGNFDFAEGWEFQLTGYNIFNADHIDPEKNGYVENDYPRWDRHFMGKVSYTF